MIFGKFLPTYLTAGELVDLCPTVLTAINRYVSSHPETKYPEKFPDLIDLVSHIESGMESRHKRGSFAIFSVVFYSAF